MLQRRMATTKLGHGAQLGEGSRYSCDSRRQGLGPCPVCTASTTVLAGGARVASTLTTFARPTITPHNMAETHQSARRRAQRARRTAREGREGEREGDGAHVDEAASTADGLGSCVS